MKLSQVAAQLYTVRDFCKTAPEFAESIKKIKAIGYGAAQISGVGPISEDEIVRICRGEGVAICATHEKASEIADETQKVVDRLGKLGCKFTAYPHPHVKPQTLDDVKRMAATLDKAGEKLRAAGQVLTYHNHAHEFRKFSGRVWLDVLYSETDARNLQGEPDTFWVQSGGGNPVEWCTKLYRRLPLLHMKDYGITEQSPKQGVMMEIGNGTLDWRAIVSAADASGCEWFIVEQDVCPADPFVSLKQSYDYIKANLVEREQPHSAKA
jgi:sugar phosphate isomerase/epimerase